LAALAMLAALYAVARPAYNSVLYVLGVRPFDYPFADFEAMLAGAQCWRHGIDVYVQNPCDVLGRPHDYSPLWLRLDFLPGIAWNTTIGWALAIGFFLSLAALPPPRNRRAVAIILIALLSPNVAFAVERANVDVVIFLLAVGAGVWFAAGSRQRLGAYGLVLIAGLLKFYPLAVLAMTLREPPRRFVAVNLIAVAILIAFVFYFRTELTAIAANIPGGSPFTDIFGAINLPRGIGFLLERGHLPMAGAAPGIVWALLLAGAAARIVAMTRSPERRRALTAGSPAEMTFLILGALLVDGCFFAGQNMGNRGILLLFVMPGLTAIAAAATTPALRRFAWRTSICVAILMWAGAFTWRSGVPSPLLDSATALMAWRVGIPETTLGTVVAAVLWVARELIWWNVAAVLAGFILSFALESETGAWVTRRFALPLKERGL
jgi:hypothetical protein